MPLVRSLLRAASLLVLLLGVASEPSIAGAPDVPTIVMARDFMFAPTAMTVAAGSTVTWTNKDDEPHTVVSDTGLNLSIVPIDAAMGSGVPNFQSSGKRRFAS